MAQMGQGSVYFFDVPRIRGEVIETWAFNVVLIARLPARMNIYWLTDYIGLNEG